MKITDRDVKLVTYILKDRKPGITQADVILGIQVMTGRRSNSPYMSPSEACRLLGMSKYHIRKLIEQAGLRPVMMRRCPGGEEPIYDGIAMLDALGYDRPTVDAE